VKRLIVLAMIALTLALPATVAAGSPHFVGNGFSITVEGNTVTITAKEAGLGDEDQIEALLTADARCINPGGNRPQAGNKQSFSAAGTFPVQNGKANISLTLTATFQPDCTPPMTVLFSNIVLTDLTNGLVHAF
jgi:hypothetical protein